MLLKKFNNADFSIDEKGVFTGYVSVFNGVDSYGDTIAPEAYDYVLEEIKSGRAPMPKLFFNHDKWDAPIGKWLALEKDQKGLFGKGQVNLNIERGKEIYECMKFGSVDGLSVSILVVDYDETAEQRTIKSIKAMREISIVTYPADNDARITDIKSAVSEYNSLKDIEKLLRDVANFSKTDATAIVSAVKRIAKAEADARRDADADTDALNAIWAKIHQITK